MKKLSATQLIKAKLEIRRITGEIKVRHKEELKTWNERDEQIDNLLQKIMLDAGTRSLKSETGKGVAYIESIMSCNVLDRDAFLDFVENEEPTVDYDPWDLLDVKANKTHVRAYMERREREKKEHPEDDRPIVPDCLNVTWFDKVKVQNK